MKCPSIAGLHRKITAALSAACLAMLCACSALNGANQAVTQVTDVGVSLLTIQAVQSNCPTSTYPSLPACYYARAQVIQNIITTVEAAATSPTATLSSLQASIAQAVATAPVQDQAALTLLLNQLVISVNANASSANGVIGQLQQATITTVGGWITAVTSGYKAPAT